MLPTASRPPHRTANPAPGHDQRRCRESAWRRRVEDQAAGDDREVAQRLGPIRDASSVPNAARAEPVSDEMLPSRSNTTRAGLVSASENLERSRYGDRAVDCAPVPARLRRTCVCP